MKENLIDNQFEKCSSTSVYFMAHAILHWYAMEMNKYLLLCFA